MKLSIRLLAASLVLIFFVVALYTTFTTHNPFHDVWTQYSVPDFIVHTFHPTSLIHPSNNHHPITSKTIVIAKTKSEDTNWVSQDLYDWDNAIYAVDRPHPSQLPSSTSSSISKPAQEKAKIKDEDDDNEDLDLDLDEEQHELTTPANKGHEAMAYLTYIIDNYAALPDIIAFLHPHRAGFFSAWHTDTPLHSNPHALHTLNLTYVQQQGYVNLRCNWSPGCRPPDRINAHVTEQIWHDVFDGTTLAGEPFPGQVGQACCAQFAVSGDRVRERPRADYQRIREWLVATELSDRRSGRVLEFLWQVIFGMGGVFCPEEGECYCRVYGRC